MLRERKFEFCAWLVFEVSKNWAEADADIAETIDFCEYYAREALRLSRTELPVQMPGERDTLMYIPLGVGAVIPPWNFPCAIMAGMTLASIVSGNTVILKPSSDSPTIAAKFVELLEECGMPEGVVNFCPGAGASFGNAVVAHPKTRYIAFTGSREVGLRHQQERGRAGSPARSGSSAPFSKWAARTPSSWMPTPTLTPPSKASPRPLSASRARSARPARAPLLTNASTTYFWRSCRARVEKITVGDPAENANMGAVINEGSMKSILDYIEVGKKDGRVITGGGPAKNAGEGYFLQPTVIADIPAGSRLEQEEIFGPRAGRDQVEELRAMRSTSPTTRNLASPARSIPSRTTRSRGPSRNSTSATCTSTASAPALLLRRILSADSTCRARIPSPAARIICICSPRAKRWGEKI